MSLLTLSPEVQTAQSERQPLVALESTIITHGMPWPENLKMAQDVEQCCLLYTSPSPRDS